MDYVSEKDQPLPKWVVDFWAGFCIWENSLQLCVPAGALLVPAVSVRSPASLRHPGLWRAAHGAASALVLLVPLLVDEPSGVPVPRGMTGQRQRLHVPVPCQRVRRGWLCPGTGIACLWVVSRIHSSVQEMPRRRSCPFRASGDRLSGAHVKRVVTSPLTRSPRPLFSRALSSRSRVKPRGLPPVPAERGCSSSCVNEKPRIPPLLTALL